MDANKLLLKTFQEFWIACQMLTPTLDEITPLEAIDQLLSFGDHPQGIVQNQIDSYLMGFETEELTYIKSLLVANL